MSTERPPDPDRGITVNSATDPQRPGEPTWRRPTDGQPPGTSAEETSVPAGPFDATHEPGSPAAPEDPGRGRGERGAL
jgi:hypothetical protein